MAGDQGTDSGSDLHTETISDTENADAGSKVDAGGNVYTSGDVSHQAVEQIELLVRLLQGELEGIAAERARLQERSRCTGRTSGTYSKLMQR